MKMEIKSTLLLLMNLVETNKVITYFANFGCLFLVKDLVNQRTIIVFSLDLTRRTTQTFSQLTQRSSDSLANLLKDDQTHFDALIL